MARPVTQQVHSIMDQDELLARQLQAEELGQVTRAGNARFSEAIEDIQEKVEQANDELNQALALSVMPLEELQETAQRTFALNQDSNTGSQGPSLQLQDYVMMELLVWFKGFFQWVDAPKCDRCCGPTRSSGVEAPSSEERSHQAGRTETFVCQTCGATVRFPRYNSVAKLVETRRGRCGEWANAFLLFCRSAGFDARYIWDINDHVWTEYWSDALGRWVHLDSCEAAFDKPLLYEAGWGKNMSYVLAGNSRGVVDVTCRYTSKWLQVLTRRTKISEDALSQLLRARTQRLRAALDPATLQQCSMQDVSEEQELSMSRSGMVSSERLQGLGARTTGSEAWRQERGEAGTQGPACASQPPPPPQSTPWCALPKRIWAQPGADQGQVDAAGGDVFGVVGRLQGGGCRAAGENGRAEGSARAFDGDAETKWLDFGASGVGGSSWIEFKLEPGQPAQAVVAYDLVSANDSEERDPQCWVLEGWREEPGQGQQENGTAAALVPGQSPGGGQWVQLDRQQGVVFDQRHQLRTFRLSGAPVPCRSWRLTMTKLRDPATANSVQLACWNLYCAGLAWPTLPEGLPASPHAGVEHWAMEARSNTPTLQLTLLTKLVANVANNPTSTKFRCIRASKLVSLWRHTPALVLLLALGFRPIIRTAPVEVPVAAGGAAGAGAMLRGGGVVSPAGGAAGAATSRDVWLVMEAGPEAVARAAAAAAILQG